jgi:poly(3-hydroxybutyrate) depolymerase
LIFVFHGLGGDGDQIRSYFGFEAQAGGQALFVYPDGLVVPAEGETGWDESDLPFFDAMMSEISASHCVDAKRIFAAGHSFGAYMSNLVGCERGDVVRAIAPVSGGLVAAGACKGPVAAWLAHGDMDPIVAQSEGIAARDHWIGANGCASTSKPTTPSPCVAYDGCSANHPVTWCSFPGGHFPLPAFTQQAIWDFFKVL